MKASFKWLLSLVWEGICSFLKLVVVLLLFLILGFAIGSVASDQVGVLKDRVMSKVEDTFTFKTDWPFKTTGVDPPVIERVSPQETQMINHDNPFGYMHPSEYKGFVSPLRL